jgi:hypothetical protein
MTEESKEALWAAINGASWSIGIKCPAISSKVGLFRTVEGVMP